MTGIIDCTAAKVCCLGGGVTFKDRGGNRHCAGVGNCAAGLICGVRVKKCAGDFDFFAACGVGAVFKVFFAGIVINSTAIVGNI